MCEFVNKVYNQDGKEMFLESIELDKYPPRWWERLFEKTIDLEEKFGKDLFGFTTPEIIILYKYLDVFSLESLMVYNLNLIKYGDWALINNLSVDGQNHFAEITNETLASCVNEAGVRKSIITEEQLEEILRQIDNAIDKYMFYALWEGIKGKEYCEILELKLSDINVDTKEVTLCTGRTIKVSQRFISICQEADRQVDYVNYSENKEIVRHLIPSITIYKEKFNSRGIDKPRTLYNTLLRCIKYLGLSNYLSINSIYHSGLIHHLNIIAEKCGMSVEDLLNDPQARKEVVNKYNFNIDARKRFLLKYKNYLR